MPRRNCSLDSLVPPALHAEKLLPQCRKLRRPTILGRRRQVFSAVPRLAFLPRQLLLPCHNPAPAPGLPLAARQRGARARRHRDEAGQARPVAPVAIVAVWQEGIPDHQIAFACGDCPGWHASHLWEVLATARGVVAVGAPPGCHGLGERRLLTQAAAEARDAAEAPAIDTCTSQHAHSVAKLSSDNYRAR